MTTLDGGQVWYPKAFTVDRFVQPTVKAITPTTTWYRNVTVPFVITGTNFEPGLTNVTISYPSNRTALNRTYGLTINYINATTINGTVVNLDYIGDNNDLDLYLNKTAADLQLVDLLAKEKIARTKETKPSPLNLKAEQGEPILHPVGPNEFAVNGHEGVSRTHPGVKTLSHDPSTPKR